MNNKSILNKFGLKGKSGVKAIWKPSNILITALAVAMIALAIYSVVPTSRSVASNVTTASQSTNPELSAVRRYAANRTISQGTNPELLVVSRFNAKTNRAGRYFLAVNPELIVANRLGGGATNNVSEVINPELWIAQRYASNRYSAAFLATNPEIKVHLRYVALKD